MRPETPDPEDAAEPSGTALLAGGSAMGRRIGAHDWTPTPLGPPDAWPQSLKIAARIMLDAPGSMLIFWGEDGICLYNDGFAGLLGADRQASILGRPISEAFAAGYPVIREELEAVLAGRGVTCRADGLVPVFRGGRIADTYWTYSFSPIIEPAAPSGVGGVLVSTSETTPAVAARQASDAHYRTLFDSIDAGFCIVEIILDAEERAVDYRFVEVNRAFESQTGLKNARGQMVSALVPGIEQHWIDIYAAVARTGEPMRFIDHAPSMGRWFDIYAFRIGAPSARQVAILFHDISERKRVETALRDSEQRFRLMADAVPQIVWIADAEGRAEFYNKRWYDYTGAAAGESAGAEVTESHVHPADMPATAQAFAAARNSAGHYHAEHRIRSKTGEWRWFVVRGEPYCDPETGEIRRWFGACVDIHDRRLAEEALKENERRMLDWFRQSPGFICVLRGPNHVFEFINDSYRRLIGKREVVGLPVREGLPEVVEQGFIGLLDDVLRSGVAYRGIEMPVRLQRVAGGPLEDVFVDFVYQPIRDPLGKVSGVFVEGFDTTERVAGQAALRASEARLRLILDSATEYAIVTIDREGRIVSWNSGAERLLGHSEAEVLGQSADIFFTPEDVAARAPEAEMAEVRRHGRAANERWHQRKDESRFWGSGVMLPVESERDDLFIKIFRDRTNERLSEERRQLLVNELNHRVKNTLATVQAIAAQSFRGDAAEAHAKQSFTFRLRALASAHDVLTRESWERAELRQIVATALEPFQPGTGERLAIDGPIFYVAPKGAVSLAMALHELATNAAKYGALSNEAGRVEIRWKVAGAPGRERFRFLWRERNGPAVAPPAHRGFGTRMIERILASEFEGEARIVFPASGVECRIDAPVRRLLRD
ncbi:hypothetical protein BH23PSE1_BH23PSE1_04490 [soil metagenome]